MWGPLHSVMRDLLGRPANSAHQCITAESRRSRSRRDDYDEGSTTVLLRDYPWYVVPVVAQNCERRGSTGRPR